MDLHKNIKDDRSRRRTKRNREEKVFNAVCSIVEAYGLGNDFLKMLDGFEDGSGRQGAGALVVKAKRPLEIPPYCMVPGEAYGLVLDIMGRLDNPYLPFARSPEEMVLSARLYECDRSIDARQLLRHDFGTLLLCLNARRELAVLEGRRAGSGGESEGEGGGRGSDGEKEFDPVSRRERIKQLRAFLAKVEQTESHAP
jgi:hypothetical protein